MFARQMNNIIHKAPNFGGIIQVLLWFKGLEIKQLDFLILILIAYIIFLAN